VILLPQNQGVEPRSLQHYLGHKNIQHTTRYTEFPADRFPGVKISVCHGVGGMFAASGTIIMSNEEP